VPGISAIEDLNLEEIQVVTGIRRSGKSTLLQTMINHLSKEHDPKSILYINFDDPNFTEIYSDAKLIYNVIDAAEKLTSKTITHLFLDEVQNVSAWEKYVKSKYDSRRFQKIVVTGSNAQLLNSDYATLLSGRYVKMQLYPLRYCELLLHNGITDNYQLVKQKPLAMRVLDNMLIHGGFPRIHCIDKESDRRKILKSYYETIILKDCIKSNDVRDTKTLTNLAYYLISNIATPYSYNSISKAVQSNENTVQKFLQIFQDAYFMSELKQYSFSLKQQSRMMKKNYCVDNGLVNAISFKFMDNVCRLLENLVYSELLKMQEGQIYFYDDNKECDFIIKDSENQLAVQVCYVVNDGNRSREINGLIAAMEKFSIDQGVIITYDQEEKINRKIQIVPFWKYFL